MKENVDNGYKPNQKGNLSHGMKPHEVKSKSDIKKYCFDHGIPAPKFSAKLKMMFIHNASLTYNQHEAAMEMASRIGYRLDLPTKIHQKS